jgi:hypothetical protein
MSKSYKKAFGENNPVGPTPGLETIFILCSKEIDKN